MCCCRWPDDQFEPADALLMLQVDDEPMVSRVEGQPTAPIDLDLTRTAGWRQLSSTNRCAPAVQRSF